MWGGGPGGSASAGDILQTFVQTEGDDTLPLSVAAFNAEVRAAMGVSEGEPVPGFNKYSPIFRKGHVGTVFVHDDGSIPESRVFNYEQPCHECHPGLCKAVDMGLMPMIKAVIKEAHKYLFQHSVGTLHCFVFWSNGDVARKHRYCVLAHKRGTQPKICMVAVCVYSDACVSLVVKESGLVKFMKDVSFIGLQIKTCAPVAKVTVEHMTWDKQCFLQGGKELRSVTAAAVGAAPIELFPDSKVPVARKSTSTLEKGLQALKGQTKRSVSGSLARRRAPSAALGARRGPEIVDYSSASGSSSSNDGSDDSRILAPFPESNPVPPPAVEPVPPPAVEPVPPPAVDQSPPPEVPWAPPVRRGVDTWIVPLSMGGGFLKQSYNHGRWQLAAHCPLGGSDMLDGVRVPRPHGPGPCRLNAATSKSPIGLLASWLLCASTFPRKRTIATQGRRLWSAFWIMTLAGKAVNGFSTVRWRTFRHCSGVSPTRAEMASLPPSDRTHLLGEAQS